MNRCYTLILLDVRQKLYPQLVGRATLIQDLPYSRVVKNSLSIEKRSLVIIDELGIGKQ